MNVESLLVLSKLPKIFTSIIKVKESFKALELVP